MPIIEEIDDSYEEEIKSVTLKDALKSVSSSLRIPKGFQDPDWAVQSHGTALISWRNVADVSISKIKLALENTDDVLDDEFVVLLISLVVPFTGSGAWVKAETRQSAESTSRSLFEYRLVHISLY